MAFIEIRDLSKSYWLHGKRIDVLRALSLDIERGELVSLVGASGSGKSTFLHVLGTLDAPVAGTMTVDGVDVLGLPDADLARFRNRTVGFVFQSHYLLPEFTALENVAIPALVQRMERPTAFRRARSLLDRVGLGARVDHRPGELSGGEAQRVALARALVLQPHVLLADEPTGNLDSATGAEIIDLLVALNAEHGTTLVIATHDLAIAERCRHVIRVHDGRITSDPGESVNGDAEVGNRA
jgi:lipoprotein-releasing system ATP-binding protein